GKLGSGGGGRFSRKGDNLTEVFTATEVRKVTALDWDLEMNDSTSKSCKVGTLSFTVQINGTKVDTYSYLGGSSKGRIKFSDSATFSTISGTGTDKDTYTLNIVANETVCSGGGSWNWYPGGTFTLNP
ncbi:MAG: hypothetical protein ACI9MC_002463, partial [Kiritimatiellia bacterium]